MATSASAHAPACQRCPRRSSAAGISKPYSALSDSTSRAHPAVPEQQQRRSGRSLIGRCPADREERPRAGATSPPPHPVAEHDGHVSARRGLRHHPQRQHLERGDQPRSPMRIVRRLSPTAQRIAMPRSTITSRELLERRDDLRSRRSSSTVTDTLTSDVVTTSTRSCGARTPRTRAAGSRAPSACASR